MTAKRFYRTVALLALLLAFCTAAMAAGILAKSGMRGESVRKVQTMLIDQGYLQGKADGVCGRQTVAAIRHFQKDRGLEVDGVCGDKTYAALVKNSKEKKPPSKEKPPVTPKVSLPPKTSSVSEDSEASTEDSPSGPHQGEAVYVEATGYSAFDPGNGPTTASGTPVRHGVIAVDPSFIPIGSRVFIPGYGEAVAEDIGGAIIGNRIDVAFDTHEEALEFGRQELEIYILETPG